MFITSAFSVIRSRSLWPYFHASVILTYTCILKPISWINASIDLLMLLFLSGLLTTWLQCYATWPKIVDSKNISSSVDTNGFKLSFIWKINDFLLIFKRSLNEILFWKETFDKWNYFIFLNKHQLLFCPVKVNNNFLPSNRNEARTYSALKTERFRMMFIVWRIL